MRMSKLRKHTKKATALANKQRKDTAARLRRAENKAKREAASA